MLVIGSSHLNWSSRKATITTFSRLSSGQLFLLFPFFPVSFTFSKPVLKARRAVTTESVAKKVPVTLKAIQRDELLKYVAHFLDASIPKVSVLKDTDSRGGTRSCEIKEKSVSP